NTGGTYTVLATNATTGCTQSMTGSVVVTVNPLPTPILVTGGGPYCSGGTGVTVNLIASQPGVNYQLRINGINSGLPLAGTNGPLAWTNQTTAGTYTVVGTN